MRNDYYTVFFLMGGGAYWSDHYEYSFYATAYNQYSASESCIIVVIIIIVKMCVYGVMYGDYVDY